MVGFMQHAMEGQKLLQAARPEDTKAARPVLL